MIKRTLHYLWGKKFVILLLALLLILLPNTIARDLQVRTTTVITDMTIQCDGDTIHITAQKFKPTAGEETLTFEEVTYQGTDIRAMLYDVSLAHCTNITFTDTPPRAILEDLYHYRDLRANTTINGDKTINDWLKDTAA